MILVVKSGLGVGNKKADKIESNPEAQPERKVSRKYRKVGEEWLSLERNVKAEVAAQAMCCLHVRRMNPSLPMLSPKAWLHLPGVGTLQAAVSDPSQTQRMQTGPSWEL